MSERTGSGARFARLRAEIRDDRRAIEKRLLELGRLPREGVWDPGSCAIAAVALHAGYGAFESVIDRVARAMEGAPPDGPNWHRELLHGAALEIEGVRPAIISPSVVAVLRQLLGFRHFFPHAYAADLDAAQLQPLVKRLIDMAPDLAKDLDVFDTYLAEVDRGG